MGGAINAMPSRVAAPKAKRATRATAADTVAYYDRISRGRALTEIESKRLAAAIKIADGPDLNYGWTQEQEDLMCEMLADGLGFTLIGRALGKSKNACVSRFQKVKRKLGWQAC